MREKLSRLLTLFLTLLIGTSVWAQPDSSFLDRVLNLPDKVFAKVDKQAASLENRINSQTEKYLSKLEREENKLKRKLSKIDSLKANEVFGNVSERYSQLRDQLSAGNTQIQNGAYSGHVDSLVTALRFLNQDGVAGRPELLSNLQNVTALQNKFRQTDQIRKLIRSRQEQLKQQLQNTPVAKELARFKKHVYYYQAQVREYQSLLNDPAALGARLINAAKDLPLFAQFFRNNSELASLFPMPAGAGTGAPGIPIPGLQTQTQVMQAIQTQFGGAINPIQSIQQQMGAAQNELQNLKRRLGQVGAGSSDDELPDFKPNGQKTKSFLQRFEFGSNLQTSRARISVPMTADVALSMGYKLNDKSIIGVAGSYRLGLGNGINNLRFSHEGVGLRSFLDVRLKGNLWISGGYEQNYFASFNRLPGLNDPQVWKQSALLGLSKTFSAKGKAMKLSRIQILYDWFWRAAQPQTQPVIVRMGYNFKN